MKGRAALRVVGVEPGASARPRTWADAVEDDGGASGREPRIGSPNAAAAYGAVPPFNAAPMTVRKFAAADAVFERSPGQEGEVYAGNVVDQRHGAPITVGFGRYGPDETLRETIAVDDVMVVLEGRLSVSTADGTVTAGPGEVVHMPKGSAVTIRSHEAGAVTAYVTYPHWQEAAARGDR